MRQYLWLFLLERRGKKGDNIIESGSTAFYIPILIEIKILIEIEILIPILIPILIGFFRFLKKTIAFLLFEKQSLKKLSILTK